MRSSSGDERIESSTLSGLGYSSTVFSSSRLPKTNFSDSGFDTLGPYAGPDPVSVPQSCHGRGQLTFTTSSPKRRKLSHDSIADDRRDVGHTQSERAHNSDNVCEEELPPPNSAHFCTQSLHCGHNHSISSPSPPGSTRAHHSSGPIEQTSPASGGTSSFSSASLSTPLEPASNASRSEREISGAEYLVTRSFDNQEQTPSTPSLGASAYPQHAMDKEQNLPDRSYSPPMKRPASELEDKVGQEPKSDIDMDRELAPEHASNQMRDVSPNTGSQESQEGSSRKRATSVDMLADEPNSRGLSMLEEQVSKVRELMGQEVVEGQKGYIVSTKWLRRVLSRTAEGQHQEMYSKDDREGDIGPVNSTDIISPDPKLRDLKDEAGEPFVTLRSGLQLGEDYEVVPQEAWDMMVHTHGSDPSSPLIVRYVHNSSPPGATENLQYEVSPPIFTILKLQGPGVTTQLLREKNASSIRIQASRYEPFNVFLKRVKTQANIPLQSKVRVWRIFGDVSETPRSGLRTPADSRSASPAPALPDGQRLLLDLNEFLALRDGSQKELLEDLKDQTASEKYNGRVSLDLVGLGKDETIVLEEQVNGAGGGGWISEAAGRYASRNGVSLDAARSGVNTLQPRKAAVGSDSRRPSPAPSVHSMTTRKRTRKDGRTRGATGLNNLGNTCYMNSALQCVRSVEELTQYFLMDKYKRELNPSNPLSHNGEVAKAYANLLTNLFADVGTTSFSPRTFKNVLGRYNPSFSGYGQQDSQEFLGFLLDGLQEDLNRIQKKPYIEKPDSTDEMTWNHEALKELADKCWDIYKARNDSVVADLFAGTYKSTLLCPACHKVSITFDPFNNLTLQLPIESVWSKEIYFFPRDGRPIRVDVDMDKNGSIRMLKEFVAKKMNVDWQRLIVAEIFKMKFYRMFDDFSAISESNIQRTDEIGVFEVDDVPTNYPAPKKKQRKQRSFGYSYGSYGGGWDEEDEIPHFSSPVADKMLVPVFFRRPAKSTDFRSQSPNLFGVPSYIVLSREEAMDYDSILRKVLRRVATMTTMDICKDDALVQQKAVSQHDEEGDTVLTTKEDASVKSAPVKGEQGLAKNNKDFVPGHLRNLFEMRLLKSNTEMVPTGLNSFEHGNLDFPLIASRMRCKQDAVPVSADTTPSSSSESEETTDGSYEHVEHPQPSNQEGADDSDSEEFQSVERMFEEPSRHNNDKQAPSNTEGADEEEEGPLVRPGEALILDFFDNVYDALFSEDKRDTLRGNATWEDIPIYHDTDLIHRRAMRANRRKAGVSLYDCLDEFGKEEILSENDAWYCPRCKEHRRASKKFELWKAPDILIMHLKRFSANRSFRDKLDVLVDFPIEGLDLGDRVAFKEEGKSTVYDLFAVDNHYGGLGGGHYTAFAQNFYDKCWYEYNDSHVSKRHNPESVVTPAAYLLFYRRRSDKALGGPFFEQILEEAYQEPESPSSSRPESPAPQGAGDGRQLDDSSRSGLSSALAGAGAAHQNQNSNGMNENQQTSAIQLRSGNGETSLAHQKQNNENQPPSYSHQLPAGEQTLEAMDMDDEGLGGSSYGTAPDGSSGYNSYGGPHYMSNQPAWSFESIGHEPTAAPPASDDGGEEDLFDGGSDRAANGSSDGFSDAGNRMQDFADDEGVLGGFDSTPQRRSLTSTPVDDLPTPFSNRAVTTTKEVHVSAAPVTPERDDNEDLPVAEVHVEEGEGVSQ
ncbi:UCH-domain-containing protein [Xylona heveae TC161]|uniref:ubiquitinyl hydrolase 1 n=1 Tax=Xylona heveae (strain CBS 132557 / TC161) TaxID=1328760 RepID=A0A165G2B1_XYLHT|nr:UCH-domain-containing protein [Xylona heveae TC161]KZF21658.1 UCH-domain-containing protein [Xylona heveae TC161]